MNRILLVDDEQGILDLLGRLVTPLGYSCVKASSGEEACAVLARERFHIMLTDMVMPGMDGMELLRHAAQNFPEMDVLVLTGFSGVYSYTDVIREGAADFLEKPVNKDELKAKLLRVSREQVLRQSLRREIEVRKKAEAELLRHQLHLQDLIEQRTGELREANEKLLEEIEERKEAEQEVRDYAEKIKLFTYFVSHDLKTPALSINGLAEILLRKCPDGTDGKFIDLCEHISGSAKQLIKLVDNINVYIRSKETPLDLEEVSARKVVESLHREFAGELSDRGVQLKTVSELPVLRADSLGLSRIFRNYIENALKYGGDGLSTIEISCNSTDGCHVFRVSNDGVGLELGEVENIFGLFNRGSAMKIGKGSGLGLAIVREIAGQHQGRAWVESDLPGITSFCFSISTAL